MKVVGNGLIASAFMKIEKDYDILVLASGVSNSNEKRQSEFDRELSLVRSAIGENQRKLVLYFSTTSVNFKVNTPYVHHKINMEREVMALSERYFIARLPQVVGCGNNNKTLISFFVESIILNRKQLFIQREATRSLIDVEDIARITTQLVPLQGDKSIVFSLTSLPISACDIVEQIYRILNVKPFYKLVDGGLTYREDTSQLKELIGANDIVFKKNYWKNVLEKYVLNLASK